MDTAGLLHAIKTSLDTTALGPAAGYITATWGVLRVTLPLLREWMAARREARESQDRRSPSFRLAYEYAVEQNLKNHEAWEKERAQLLAQQSDLLAEIKSLKSQARKEIRDED